MVKKKRGTKSSSNVKKVSGKDVKKRSVRLTKKKINLVLRNLALFATLTLVFFILYNFSNNILFRSLFQLLAMILGFVGIAFLIILLALLILNSMNKRKSMKKR